jgi:hypothetical protein
MSNKTPETPETPDSKTESEPVSHAELEGVSGGKGRGTAPATGGWGTGWGGQTDCPPGALC